MQQRKSGFRRMLDYVIGTVDSYFIGKEPSASPARCGPEIGYRIEYNILDAVQRHGTISRRELEDFVYERTRDMSRSGKLPIGFNRIVRSLVARDAIRDMAQPFECDPGPDFEEEGLDVISRSAKYDSVYEMGRKYWERREEVMRKSKGCKEFAKARVPDFY